MPSTENIDHIKPYISRVRLGGYKSIIDMEIVLKKGLNIIIGPIVPMS